MEFKAWPKIIRLENKRAPVFTEKIDGTNACIVIGPNGEWWGLGIQRGYDLKEKRFSLFNTRRWGPHNPNTPSCVSVVPIINANTWDEARSILILNGSFAAPGYKRPEGLVMYEPDTDTCFKIIIDK